MNPSEILDYLSKKNVVVEVNDNQLKIKAPKGAVTEQIAGLIRAKKVEIIEHLSSQYAYNHEEESGSRRYTLDNGSVLELSEDEFSNLVEIFKMLKNMRIKHSHEY